MDRCGTVWSTASQHEAASRANLAALLFGLKKRAPKKYRAIVDVIRAVAPFFDEFVLEPDEMDRKVVQLEWRHKSDPSYFDANSLSDGTLRFMCLAALLLQPTKPSVIVIDEPSWACILLRSCSSPRSCGWLLAGLECPRGGRFRGR